MQHATYPHTQIYLIKYLFKNVFKSYLKKQRCVNSPYSAPIKLLIGKSTYRIKGDEIKTCKNANQKRMDRAVLVPDKADFKSSTAKLGKDSD